MAHEPAKDPALVDAIVHMTFAIDRLVAEVKPAESIVEDIDLVAANPAKSCTQKANEYTEAIQVDNPYAVTIEVRGSRDGGGPIVMRVPAHTSRVLTVRVRYLSLRAIGGNPAGVIPATLVRFDRPQPAGLFPYAP